MRAAILAIGSELLGVDRLDTNSLRLTSQLHRHGLELVGKSVVGDSVEEIARAVRRWTEEVEILVLTGGLGPTTDDLTRHAVAHALGLGLRQDPEIEADIEAKFRRFGLAMPEVNRRQAEVLDGADVLANRRGTAPGLRLKSGACTVYLLPGVPAELQGMIDDHLGPDLERLETGARRETWTLKVACLPESTVEERLAPAYAEFGPQGITVLASAADISVRIFAEGPVAERQARLAAMSERLSGLIGDAVYSRREESLETVVGSLLTARGQSVATAESCTGGLIAQRLTSVAGSSGYFVGGEVVYSNRAKRRRLGVPGELLDVHGAVSEAVALAMVHGVRQAFETDYGVAVTGIAGPGGGSEEKPVGLVHLAVEGPDGATVHRRLVFPGDRERVRRFASQWALDLLRRRLLPGAAEYPRLGTPESRRDLGDPD